MLLDRAARATVRNFSTLFLVCMVVMLPLEITYAFLHRDAIATRELHRYIEDLPARQRVRGVGHAELNDASRDRGIVTGIELLLLPLLASAARRILESEREGRLPTTTDAYRRGLAPFSLGRPPGTRSLGPLAVAAIFALCVGFAAYRVGLLVAEVFPDRLSFGILGTVEAAARSVALPWFLVTWAEVGGGANPP